MTSDIEPSTLFFLRDTCFSIKIFYQLIWSFKLGLINLSSGTPCFSPTPSRRLSPQIYYSQFLAQILLNFTNKRRWLNFEKPWSIASTKLGWYFGMSPTIWVFTTRQRFTTSILWVYSSLTKSSYTKYSRSQSTRKRERLKKMKRNIKHKRRFRSRMIR